MAVLAIDALTVRLSGATIVDRASFTVRPGEIVAIVGPNGAGKTTLLEAVIGLRAGHGRVALDGKELPTFAARAGAFAFMPDEAALPEEVSIRTLIGAASRDPERRARETRRFAIKALLDRGGRELSRGEAKRVWLALTTLLDRPVLVLDEPFGAFDPLQLDAVLPAVRDAIGARGLALVTIHQMSIAERIADRIVMLAEGQVVAEGTLAELRRSAGLDGAPLEDVFRGLLRRRSADAPA
jgi:ABC-type multidrug transport system ATPase subunit